MESNANIVPRVIEALQESESDPAAAIRRLEREAAEHEAEAQRLRQAVVGLKHMTGQVPTQRRSPEEVPQGMEAVRRVMGEGGVWTAGSLFDELKRRGWEPKDAQHPKQTVEAAMDRLYRVKKELDRVGRGEYTYKGFPASPVMLELS